MKKEKVQQLAHMSAGVLVLWHAFQLLDGRNLQSALLLVTLSLIFVFVAAVHKWVVKTFSNGDVPVFLLEVVTLLFIAWSYIEADKIVTPIILAIAALLILVLVGYTLVTDRDTHHKSSRRGRWKRRRSGSRRLSSTNTR